MTAQLPFSRRAQRWRAPELVGALALLFFGILLPVPQHHEYIPTTVVDGHVVPPWSLSMPCNLEGTLCSASEMTNASSPCAALRARHVAAGMQVSNALLILLSVLLPIALLLACAAVGGGGGLRTVSPAPDTLLATLLSLALAALVTSFLKRNVGRPRPNFYALLALDPKEYAGTAYRSFPSGHSSTAMAGLHPLSLWLFSVLCAAGEARVCPRALRSCSRPSSVMVRGSGSGTSGGGGVGGGGGGDGGDMDRTDRKRHGPCLAACARPVLFAACFLPSFLAVWIGATRIEDGWHHVGDVLAGELIGAAAAHIALTYARATSPRTCAAWSDARTHEPDSMELLAEPLHSSAAATSAIASRSDDEPVARGSAAV